MWLDWLNTIKINNDVMTNEEVLKYVMDKSNNFWAVKFVHASGHGWQHKDHGNSKAQLSFDVDKFFDFFDDLTEEDREKFVGVVWHKNIHHDNTVLTLENQSERSAQRNKKNVLHHLRWILFEFLEEEKDRIETKVPPHEKKKRIDDKKHNSKKKQNRKVPEVE